MVGLDAKLIQNDKFMGAMADYGNEGGWQNPEKFVLRRLYGVVIDYHCFAVGNGTV